jgi:hypothetical protein
MTRTQIIDMQKRIGTTPDGFWGPRSIAACQQHLRSLMPSPNPWPSTLQPALTGFYGNAGDESRLTFIDVTGLGMRFAGTTVTRIRVHERCAASLLRIIRDISASPFRYVLSEFGGVYNNRPMRGGTLPSLHARGAAIDLMPATNGNLTHWPTRANMPLEVMEIFAREGWLPAGAFWSRDAMHFQATK